MPTVSLSPRDHSLLRFLSWTPATTALLWQASATFNGDRFPDEQRLRERLRTLGDADIVRPFPVARAAGGTHNYYKLTALGFEVACGPEEPMPPRAFFEAVRPSLADHTFRLAEAIVTILIACHARGVEIVRVIRENELTFTVGARSVQPDCFVRLLAQGMSFNLALEVDNGTVPVDSHAANGIRHKLITYDAYQQQILQGWLAAGKTYERPRFRVVFLTTGNERAHHILDVAARITRHPDRRLAYAAPFDVFVRSADPLFAPLFLDHYGQWQALVDPHPTTPFLKPAVRLFRPLASPVFV